MGVIERPACHGLPTAVSAACASCRSCEFASTCVHEAFELLDQLPVTPETQRERLTLAVTRRALAGVPRLRSKGEGAPLVTASSRGITRLVLTDAQEQELKRLPAKVASQVRQLLQRGWFDYAKSELRAGRNPADKGWKQVLCRLLLAGEPTRAQLELALVEQLDLSPASAKVQASVGLAVFAAGRLATERLGRIALNPN